ncbi:hypothetical protein C7S18_16495 [Ahniella affigens]|uniref:Response regulatory domain-containing protein n=1 Tax=Ahniella affigens TaxID=2021234 RepID=A0A2P1PV20_9GAMM|nr:response regulator [Ahniella affigens]AVP98688.1 hypothetical protein C7S18_16495 [Ahniella affigens]
MNKRYTIGLCGLTARDARLIEIVIARAPNPKYTVRVGDSASIGRCELAIVDTQAPQAADALAKMRSLNPHLVVIEIAEQAGASVSGYRVQRSSLLLMILRTVERAIEDRLANGAGSGTATINQLRALPDTIVEPAAGHNDRAAQAGVSLQPLAALIVDDSLAVRTQLETVLARVGITAHSADGAEAALKQVAQHNFDLIFLDVVMPGIDGYELCRRIKQNSYTRKIPILMLTSRSSPFDRARGALAGCDAYLVKPITSQVFFASVDKVLNKYAQGNRDTLAARGYRVVTA